MTGAGDSQHSAAWQAVEEAHARYEEAAGRLSIEDAECSALRQEYMSALANFRRVLRQESIALTERAGRGLS